MAVFEHVLDEPSPSDHIVQFYELDERVLAKNVVRYCGEGLSRGECVILVATPDHTTTFLEALKRRGFDADQLIRDRHIVLLDAEQTVNRILLDSYPNGAKFDAVVGVAVREASAGHTALRAYGEMVGLLWNRREFPAAIRLEQLWHKLLREHPFSLFCAYPIDIFASEFDQGIVDALLSAHTHLFSAGANGEVQSAVEKAVKDAVGTTLVLKGADLAFDRRTEMPRGEELILWVRKNFAGQADEILTRARQYYCEARSSGSAA